MVLRITSLVFNYKYLVVWLQQDDLAFNFIGIFPFYPHELIQTCMDDSNSRISKKNIVRIFQQQSTWLPSGTNDVFFLFFFFVFLSKVFLSSGGGIGGVGIGKE